MFAEKQIFETTGYTPDIRFMMGKSNIDQARSMLATDFYKECTDQDVMLFIDSDHIFSIDDIKHALQIGGDVSCGIYPNAIGKPTCYMLNPEDFINGIDDRIRFAGTGFMMIRRPIMTKIKDYLTQCNGFPFARVSGPQYNEVIPFFKQQIVATELGPGGCGVYDWLGEDYSFCWMVRQCQGTIRGFITRTLGHEVLNVRVFYPPPENCLAVKNGVTIRNKLPVINQAQQDVANDLLNKLNQTPQREGTLNVLTDPPQSSPVQLKSPTNHNETETETEIELPLELQQIINNINHTTVSKSKPREIVYFCGLSRVTFSPSTSGLGGSEQSVVNLSREWHKCGYNVTVYGNVQEGVYDGVNYVHVSKFDLGRKYDYLVMWRGFGLQIIRQVNANHLYIDLHDRTSPMNLPLDQMYKVEKIFVKSEWHKTNWTHLPIEKYVTIRNGLNKQLYDQVKKCNLKRNPHQICYTSCYTRGLIKTLEMCWPIIKKHVPDAEFHICYGYELVSDPNMRTQIERMLKMPGIKEYGRVSAHKVAEIRAQSAMHLYLCNDPTVETDCISVRESIYSGCVPVVFDEGVFKERKLPLRIPIGQGTLPQDKYTQEVYTRAAVVVVRLMQNTDLLNKVRDMPSIDQDWSEVAKQWIDNINHC